MMMRKCSRLLISFISLCPYDPSARETSFGTIPDEDLKKLNFILMRLISHHIKKVPRKVI